MKRKLLTVIFLAVSSMSLVAPALGAVYTYTENFDTAANWGGGTMSGYNGKYYVNTAEPSEDYFIATNAVQETAYVRSGYAWRLGNQTVTNMFFRYACRTNVLDFSVYLANWWTNSFPTNGSWITNFVVRYSTDSGMNYTTLLSTNGSWWSEGPNKTYQKYSSGTLNITPAEGQEIYLEVFRTSGERLLIDDFTVDYGDIPSSGDPSVTITNPETVSVSVPYETGTFDLQGSCNSEAVGDLTWTNNLTGGMGAIALETNWTLTGIALEVGDNVLTVSASNSEGVVASDSVTVTRWSATPTNVQFTASSNSVSEGAGTYEVTVYKTHDSGTVYGEIELSGTALEGPGNDYTLSATNFTLDGATTSATITVIINDDTNSEPPETAIMTLANVAGGTIDVPNVFTLNIADNETGPGELCAFRFNFTPYLPVSAKTAHLAVTPMSLSTGTIGTNITFGIYFPDEPYIQGSALWTNDSQASANYFWFTITPDPGYALSISGISFRAYASAAGPSAFSYDIAGGLATYTENAPDSTLAVVSQVVSGVENQSAAVTVLIQGWLNGSRASTGGGDFRLDDVVIYGEVVSGGFDPNADDDGDGIPNGWELLYFGGATNADPLAYSDGDPVDNLDEYIADTDPTNGESFFDNAITNVTGRGTLILYAGPPTTNSRVYDAWSCTNLVEGDWAAQNLNVPGAVDGAAVALTVTNDVLKRFYRTGVKLP